MEPAPEIFPTEPIPPVKDKTPKALSSPSQIGLFAGVLLGAVAAIAMIITLTTSDQPNLRRTDQSTEGLPAVGESAEPSAGATSPESTDPATDLPSLPPVPGVRPSMGSIPSVSLAAPKLSDRPTSAPQIPVSKPTTPKATASSSRPAKPTQTRTTAAPSPSSSPSPSPTPSENPSPSSSPPISPSPSQSPNPSVSGDTGGPGPSVE